MEYAVPLKLRKLITKVVDRDFIKRIIGERGDKLRHLLLAAIVLAAAASLGTGLYLWLSGGGSGESIRIVTAVQIPYPDSWSEQPLTEADGNAGLLLKLERERPEASFVARTVIAGLALDFDLNQLADDTEAALSAEIENFDLLSKSVVPIGPFDAVRITYRQADDVGLTAHQVLMTIVPTSNQTFYLTFRAERADFLEIEDEGSEIIDTYMAYVAEVLR